MNMLVGLLRSIQFSFQGAAIQNDGADFLDGNSSGVQKRYVEAVK